MGAFYLGVSGSITVFREAENGVVILSLEGVSVGRDKPWKKPVSAIAGTSENPAYQASKASGSAQ